MRALLPAAVLTSMLAVAGCGGSASSDSKDEDEVRSAVTASLKSKGPSSCAINDPGFVRRIFGSDGECRKKQQDDSSKPPTAVEVSAISIDGEDARARVLTRGGDSSGSQGGIRAHRSGGRWRVSDFDVDLLRSDLAQSLATPDPELPELSKPAIRSCLVAKFGKKPDAEFRRFAYAAIAEKPAAVNELFASADTCLKASGDIGPSLLRRTFERGVTSQLRKSGTPPAMVRCVVRRLRQAFTERDLMTVTNGPVTPDLQKKIVAAVRACGGGQAPSGGGEQTQ